jgi:hypothetical protein
VAWQASQLDWGKCGNRDNIQRVPMNEDPQSGKEGSGAEQPGPPAASTPGEKQVAPPPPPSPEAIARLRASSRPDFAASAAMVNDILNAGPAEQSEGPEREAAVDDSGGSSGPPAAPVDQEAPMAPDFYTSTRRKKRFRHSK